MQELRGRCLDLEERSSRRPRQTEECSGDGDGVRLTIALDVQGADTRGRSPWVWPDHGRREAAKQLVDSSPRITFGTQVAGSRMQWMGLDLEPCGPPIPGDAGRNRGLFCSSP